MLILEIQFFCYYIISKRIEVSQPIFKTIDIDLSISVIKTISIFTSERSIYL